jgi:hypothetical protein
MTDIGGGATALSASLNLSGVNVVTNVSGQTVFTNVSGNTLNVGGTVTANVTISGNVVSVSGNTVSISGNSIREFGSSILAAPAVVATSLSGGVELGSGVVFNVNVRGMSVNSGVLYVGGTGTNAPFSGQGQVMAATDPALTFKVDNLNRIRVFATASGDRVTFAGIV